MLDPHFLACGAQGYIAAVVQLLGAALESPSEPARALVEAADEDEQIVGRGIDTACERDDRAIEVIDRRVPGIGRGDGGIAVHLKHRYEQEPTVLLHSHGSVSTRKAARKREKFNAPSGSD